MPDGLTYVGHWNARPDRRHGQADPVQRRRLRGRPWSTGNAQGTGKVTYANGDIYEGGFAGDKRTEGHVHRHRWLRLRRQLDRRPIEGDGKVTYPDGPVYEGRVQRRPGQRHGKIIYPDGNHPMKASGNGRDRRQGRRDLCQWPGL